MSFDTIAPVYRVIEYAAFGRDLERARTCLDAELVSCRSVLVLGEGDGRWLAGFLRRVPEARVECVDASGAMLGRAARRARTTGRETRVHFVQADARTMNLRSGRYDAVVTCFFLDCFTDAEVLDLAERIAPALTPDARWLLADFAVPRAGLAALRAKAWLRLLYGFFRVAAGISARVLPRAEATLGSLGWTPRAIREHRGGLLRTVVFERAGRPIATGEGLPVADGNR